MKKSGFRKADLRYKICVTTATVLWPLISLVRSAKVTRKNGAYVAQNFKVSAWRQFAEQIILANRFNITPESYYKFKMFESASREKALSFVQHHEIVTLLPHLYRGTTIHQLDDKLQFYQNCLLHSLPTAPLVAAVNNGSMTWMDNGGSRELPRTDLVFKPANNSCGKNNVRWRYSAEDDRWLHGERSLDHNELISHLCSVATKDCYILQSALYNHTVIRPLAAKGLCTVRVVTCHWREKCSPLLASLRMPTGESTVDNFAANGLAAPVNLDTGTLGVATKKDIRAGVFHQHPDSGASITGSQLPLWRETIDLCVSAHHCFPMYPFIGWDVVLTDDGPLLLEANLTWCVELVQITNNVPLGETMFPEVFLSKLESSEADRPESVAGSHYPLPVRH